MLIKRMFEPPEVSHERLFVISVLGFIVNLVGIFVFNHGGGDHGHSHGGGSDCHGHGHSHSSHGHSHDSNDSFLHNHSHGNGHIGHGDEPQKPHSSGENKIFEGIFLHILADTMG